MRALLFAFSAVTLLTMTNAPASAADGCSWGPGGQLYCQPGARPGVPYYSGYGYGYGPRHGYHQPRYVNPGYYPPPRHHRRPKVRFYVN
jgi:hypothetical protein